MDKLKTRNKKLIIRNIGVALAIIVSFVGAVVSAKAYRFRTSEYYTNAKMVSASAEYTNEGVVELIEGVSEKDEAVFVFRSRKRGTTEATITYSMEYPKNEEHPDGVVVQRTVSGKFTVGIFGIIIDRSMLVNFSGFGIFIYCLMFVLLLTVVIMLWSFIDSFRKGAFSYAMVANGGIGIFAAILLLITAYKLYNNAVRTLTGYLVIVNEVGGWVIVLLAPVMFFLAAFLFFSNFWLIRHEGRRPANTLGILFAVLWIAATVVSLEPEFLSIYTRTLTAKIIHCVILYALCYFECMFIATVASAVLASRYRTHEDRDYIIILGCRIRKDGTLTPLLKGRVDSALKFEKAQFEKTGKHAVFVPSGGQGADEVMSEGEAMERYLLDQGVPAERILREDKSASTYENMKFSRAVIEKHCGNIREKLVAFATTNYHVFRGYILARKCGFYASGISAKTKTYFYPNAFLREFAGLLVDKKFTHAISILLIALFFIWLMLL